MQLQVYRHKEGFLFFNCVNTVAVILLFWGRRYEKSLRRIGGIIYMDGLVSTGNKFPYTILNIFSLTKKYFIEILFTFFVRDRGPVMIFCVHTFLFCLQDRPVI